MNEEAKKKILRMVPHALYVLTSRRDGQTVASTVTWLTQASFKPPLVVVALQKGSRTREMVQESGIFAVNVAAKDQSAIAQKFFKHAEDAGGKLAGEPYGLSPLLGLPIFPAMVGFLGCRVTDVVDRGDHTVMVGEVVEAETYSDSQPLLLSATPWQYGG